MPEFLPSSGLNKLAFCMNPLLPVPRPRCILPGRTKEGSPVFAGLPVTLNLGEPREFISWKKIIMIVEAIDGARGRVLSVVFLI
jgi:hypothetical protein